MALLPLLFFLEVRHSNHTDRNLVHIVHESSAEKSAIIPLKPRQVLTFEFPQLPKTLAGETPRMTLRLPDNYSSSQAYPLLIFLSGGEGGNGNNIDKPKDIIGANDYIIGNFPLFGQTNAAEPFDGTLVGFDNYPAITKAFTTFMTQINQTIPNINTDKNVIGGFSNGAHTLAVMLSALDANFLENFKYVFFIEGGEDLSWAGLARTSKLKNHHFLLIYGGGKRFRTEWWRKHTLNRAKSYREFAVKWNVDLQVEVIKGFNHDFPKEYYPIICRWLGYTS